MKAIAGTLTPLRMPVDIFRREEMGGTPNQRRLVAILAADVAGYTRLVEQDTDATVAPGKRPVTM